MLTPDEQILSIVDSPPALNIDFRRSFAPAAERGGFAGSAGPVRKSQFAVPPRRTGDDSG